MENTEARPAQRRRTGSRSGKPWANIAAALLPAVACFLGGATEKWAEGIVLVLLGLLVLSNPPALSPGRWINGIALGLTFFALFSFLPARWFFLPAWRSALLNDFAIALPSTLSPQPWVSLQYLISFLAGITWLYYVCGRDVESREIRSGMRVFGGAIVLLAALCILLKLAHTALPFWHTERGFGPFPNRNQTADLFAITAVVVLACAADDIRNHKKRWIAWTIGVAVLIAAVVIGFSRAGIILLIAGFALWLAALALRKGSVARIALGVCVLLALLTGVLLFGGETLERFHLRTGGSGMTADFRLLIFRDAIQLIRASPWCGVGFGNFEPVFAAFRDASIADTRSHHPESDWLWLWAELGWPALLLTAGGSAILFWRGFSRDETRSYRFRLAALVAALLFALHGFVDVSAHRVGTVMAGIFLLGAALPRPLQVRAKFTPWLFRAAGIMLIVAGATWTIATRWHYLLPGSVGAEMARSDAVLANRSRNFADAAALATRGLQWTPLDWQLYFIRAAAQANQRHIGLALADFRRARFLEPNAYQVPFDEGKMWATIKPTLALTAWREALRRAGSQRADIYGQMLRHAEQFNPALVAPLQTLSVSHRELVFTYLHRLVDDAFKKAMEELLRRDPNLASLDDDQRTQLLDLWSERGDRARLAAAVEQHPDWLPSASSGLSNYRAAQGDFRGAIELALRFTVRPALPKITANTSIADLQNTLAADAWNYAVGFSLYRAQRDAGRIDDALVTIRHFTELPRAPAYFQYLETDCWAAKREWERAWQAYQKYEAAIRK